MTNLSQSFCESNGLLVCDERVHYVATCTWRTRRAPNNSHYGHDLFKLMPCRFHARAVCRLCLCVQVSGGKRCKRWLAAADGQCQESADVLDCALDYASHSPSNNPCRPRRCGPIRAPIVFAAPACVRVSVSLGTRLLILGLVRVSNMMGTFISTRDA
jgi:hypothetical protein